MAQNFAEKGRPVYLLNCALGIAAEVEAPDDDLAPHVSSNLLLSPGCLMEIEADFPLVTDTAIYQNILFMKYHVPYSFQIRRLLINMHTYTFRTFHPYY